MIAVVGSSILNLVLVLGAGSWLYYHRIVRGEVLAVRERPYIDAARAVGAGDGRILVRHILPNCIGPIVVNATLAVAAALSVILAGAAGWVRRRLRHPPA